METLHQPGDTIAQRYQIIGMLGQGGMGTTYEAEDQINQRSVALKVLSLRDIKDWKVLELFEREAKTLANLHHPYIPNYIDSFHIDTPEDRRFYLVRELAPGNSLADWVLRGWRFEEEQVKQIALKVLNVLDYLHHFNPPIIHRDIKPQNIIYSQDGNLFLVDFGAVQEVYRQTLMGSNTFVGTLGYMPPEQLRGQASASSDLYALGATLLFLLTRQSLDQLPQHRMKINFRSQVNLSDQFATWLEKMIEPAFEDRFASAKAAVRSLMIPTNTAIKRSHPLQQRPVARKGRIIVQQHAQSFQAQLPLKLSMSPRTFFTILIPTLLIFGSSHSFGLFWLLIFFLSLFPSMSSLGAEYIEVDQRIFQVRKVFLGITFHRFRRPISEVEKVALNLSISQYHSTLYVGYEDNLIYPFGSILDREEQRWLATELSRFLIQVRKQTEGLTE